MESERRTAGRTDPDRAARSAGARAGTLLALLLALAAGACAPSRPAPAAAPPATPAAPARPTEPSPADRLAGLLRPPDAAVRAAEGLAPTGEELGRMWTFENPPVQQWRARYGFEATPEWLEHVRLASVRYGDSCSASFVSPDGLVMTNHHCARECIEAVSTEQDDYLLAGFQTRTREEERLCPDLFLDQLVAIQDVTERVHAAGPAGGGQQEVAQARAAEQQRIVQECQRTADACQVVPLFQGGQFQLYTYRRYEPVKLVFAPELQAGYFGGDPDNFTYPRYALDVAFVRAYEPDGTTAAGTPHFFAWNPEGAGEGDLVFVTGNPGSTSRLITVSQLLYERSYRHPFLVGLLEAQRDMLRSFAAMGPDYERAVREDLFGVENSLKAFTGQLDGLHDSLLVAAKIVWERDFRARAEATPAALPYAGVWDELEALQRRKLETSPGLNVANPDLMGAPHLEYASALMEYLHTAALPEDRRPPDWELRRQMIAEMLEQPSDVPEAQALLLLELHLRVAERWMEPGDPLRDALVRPGEDAAAAARRLVSTSRVLDVGFRRAALAAGAPVLDTVPDPLVLAAVVMDSAYAVLLPRWQAIQAEESVARGRLAQALFAVYGTDLPPDATFTLRISDGVVAGYPYNGTLAPPVTTFFGLYGRSAEFRNEMPWTLPPSFAEARERVDLSRPLNFVSTNDITGGNSGSPMIDRSARVVGVAFDGNIEQLPNEFVFRTVAGRTVSVHSAGILEALRSVHGAEALVEELLSTSR